MANDRKRSDDQYSGPGRGRQDEHSNDEQVRADVGDEIRGTADEGDEEDFEDLEDLEESEEDSDGSF
jgi:hypothetical protein